MRNLTLTILNATNHLANVRKIMQLKKIVTLIVVCVFYIGYAIECEAQISLAGTKNQTISDGVDIFSGKLANTIPLVNVKGRGYVNVGLNLSLRNLDWQVVQTGQYENPNPYYVMGYYQAKLAPMNLGGIPFDAQLKHLSRAGYGVVGKIKSMTGGVEPLAYYRYGVTTISFISNDGTMMDFRDVATDGQPKNLTELGCHVLPYPNPPPLPQACSRGRVFRSTRGENATFVSDTDLYDCYQSDYLGNVSGCAWPTSGVLYLNDGTKIIFGSGFGDMDGYNITLTRIEDRNGNYFDLEYGGLCPDACYGLSKITDSLKREINISYGDSSQPNFHDTILYKGFGGAQKELKINYTGVENTMLPGHGLTPIFPGVRSICSGGNCPSPNPPPYGNGTPATSQKVVSSITLPDNRQYQFLYNEYLEISRIKSPLGSYVDYVYGSGLVGADADGYQYYAPLFSQGINRRITAAKSYDEYGALILQKNFSQPVQYIPETQTTLDNVTVEVADGVGNLIGRSKHYFHGLPNGNSALDGKEYKTEILDPVSNAILRKNETTWEPRATYQWCNYSYNFPCNWLTDLRITEVKSTLDTGQVTKKNFSYDQYNNVTDTYEYDYGNGQAGQLLRRGHTDYVTDSNYTSHTGAHIKVLPLQMWMSSDVNGSNKTAFTQFEYDNYSVDVFVDRSNVSQHDYENYGPANIRRGNVTKKTSFADAQNQTGAISARSQYDILGNVVKTVDANGNASTIEYDDRFGTPDANARLNSAPSQLAGKNTFAFATKATNAKGFINYSQFDYSSGSVVDAEDFNENVATTFYNDILDRPTQVISANNRPGVRSQATTIYDDINKKVTVTADLYSFGDNLSRGESFYDSLGRTTETRSYEAGGFIVTAKPQYDALGRVVQATNPYRPYLNEPPVWTATTYDALGRVVKVRTPDNAEATTTFYGNITTGVDQAGKKRRSVTNAIGQVTRVDEPNSANDLGEIATPTQPTHYTYNTNGNLVKVAQGQQNRYFLYDSLGRLIRVRQPEQGTNASLTVSDPVTGNSLWSTGSTYDANGNVLSTLDAKSVSITQTYDQLNRVLTRSYSDGTPAVSYEYENQNIPNSKGQLTKIGSSVSTTEYTAFDILGKVTAHKQTTAGGDSNGYTTGYTYNLSGALIEEEYPSGRVVKNGLDNDAKLTDVSAKANAQANFHTYANNFTYAASGAVISMRYGNGRWESVQMNSRLQGTQIALGTSLNATNLWKVNYSYGEIDANGNLDTLKNNETIARQTITVPGLSQAFVQSYKYDSLSRLTEAKEMSGATQTFLQNFEYDRYGNRTSFSQQKLGEQAVTTTPTVDPTTNRFTTGQGFQYDLNGNLITDNLGRQLVFDGNNKQKEVRDVANNIVGTYSYDGSGARVKKVVGNEVTIFVYDAAGKLVAEYSTATPPANPTISYLTTDTLGSPRIITDNSGSVVSRRDFMPFGEELYAGTANRSEPAKYSVTGSDNVRKRFTGYEKDNETGLDFAEARYYDNRFGRFTAVDPLLASGQSADPQTFNRYVYVSNDPVNSTDPTGLWETGRMPSDFDFFAPEFGSNPNRDFRGFEPLRPRTDVFVPTESLRGEARYSSIYLEDGYDPEFDMYRGDVTVQLLSEDGKTVLGESKEMHNPTREQVEAEALKFTNAIRRNQAFAAMQSRGWQNYDISITPDGEGFKFRANDKKAQDFLARELNGNFHGSKNKLFFSSHSEQADCKNGGCIDYRSNGGTISHGRMQVVYNPSSFKGYVDVDRYAPHGQGIRGFLGHIFLEGFANAGSNFKNVRNLRYVGFR